VARWRGSRRGADRLPGRSRRCPGEPRVAASLIGGRPARLGEYPWAALVLDKRGPRLRQCSSGTLVTAHLVLTAGHCLLDNQRGTLLEPAGFRIVLGTGRLGAPGAEIDQVQRLSVFPRFYISGRVAHWVTRGCSSSARGPANSMKSCVSAPCGCSLCNAAAPPGAPLYFAEA